MVDGIWVEGNHELHKEMPRMVASVPFTVIRCPMLLWCHPLSRLSEAAGNEPSARILHIHRRVVVVWLMPSPSTTSETSAISPPWLRARPL